jgi:hypothetical protein
LALKSINQAAFYGLACGACWVAFGVELFGKSHCGARVMPVLAHFLKGFSCPAAFVSGFWVSCLVACALCV